MSGAQPPVGASSGSSAAVPSQQQHHLQQQEITVAQLSEGIREIIRQQQQQQEITAAQFSDAIREIIRQQQQQQQEITAAARSQSDELRGWLMFAVTLTASITYSAALNPPGGVWQADDAAKGYIAGRPVLLDKFRAQYLVFFYCNLTSFTMSLCIIVLLSTPSFYNRIRRSTFSIFVAYDILAWAGAFIAGSSTSGPPLAYEVTLISGVLAYIACHVFIIGRLRTT